MKLTAKVEDEGNGALWLLIKNEVNEVLASYAIEDCEVDVIIEALLKYKKEK